MMINSSKIFKVKVVTKSGQFLGHVKSFDIDALTHQIMKYYIKSDNIIKRLIKIDQDLAVSYSQVISIDNEYMTVDDNVIKVLAEEIQNKKFAQTEEVPTVSAKRLD